MTNKTDALAAARAKRSAEKRRSVEEAIEKIQRDGEVITFKRIADVAGVSRVYLYDNFKVQINEIRADSKSNKEEIDGIVVPNRSADQFKHIEAALRNKVKRLKKDLGDVRKENARLKIALEKSRGEAEHYRQNWINTSSR